MAEAQNPEQSWFRRLFAKLTRRASNQSACEWGNERLSKWYGKEVERDKDFKILIIGKTGSGKSTLINNLIGTEVAPVGDDVISQTSKVEQYTAVRYGVRLAIWDTPGLEDSRGGESDERTLEEIRSHLRYSTISLVIFCFNLTTNRIAEIRETFHKYQGIPWEKVVVAFTFADYLAGSSKPFRHHLGKWEKAIREEILVKELRVPEKTANKIKFCPTTEIPYKKLPDGEEWFVHLWFSVLEILEPRYLLSFLCLRNKYLTTPEKVDPERVGTLTLETLVTQYKESFGIRILDKLVAVADAIMGTNEEGAENRDEQSGQNSMH